MQEKGNDSGHMASGSASSNEARHLSRLYESHRKSSVDDKEATERTRYGRHCINPPL